MTFPNTVNVFSPGRQRFRGFRHPAPFGVTANRQGDFGVGALTKYVEKYGPKLQEYYGKLTGKEKEETAAPEDAYAPEPESAPAAVGRIGTGTLIVGGLLVLWLLNR